jgi:hypothetical protein
VDKRSIIEGSRAVKQVVLSVECQPAFEAGARILLFELCVLSFDLGVFSNSGGTIQSSKYKAQSSTLTYANSLNSSANRLQRLW